MPLSTFTLQDCADLASFLIRTTVDSLRCVGPAGFLGSDGPIDVATITAKDGLRYVQRKTPEAFGPESQVTRRRDDASVRPEIVTDVPDDTPGGGERWPPPPPSRLPLDLIAIPYYKLYLKYHLYKSSVQARPFGQPGWFVPSPSVLTLNFQETLGTP